MNRPKVPTTYRLLFVGRWSGKAIRNRWWNEYRAMFPQRYLLSRALRRANYPLK